MLRNEASTYNALPKWHKIAKHAGCLLRSASVLGVDIFLPGIVVVPRHAQSALQDEE